MPQQKSMPPASITHPLIGWIGAIGFTISLFSLYNTELSTKKIWSISLIIFLILMIGVRYYLLGLLKKTTNDSYTNQRKYLLTGILVCLLHLSIFLLFFYFVYPQAFHSAITFIPLVLTLKFIHLITDRFQGFWYDAFSKLGEMTCKRDFSKNFTDIIKSNSIKFFYLPIMLDAGYVISSHIEQLIKNNKFTTNWYFIIFNFLYLVDVSVAILGYTHASKSMDAEIKSTNPFLSGWLFALICYAPFNILFFSLTGFKAFSTPEWTNFIDTQSPLGYAYGGTIIILTACYVWGTLSFDIRFSNLTNRGIITSGPYRFLKHPSYVAKNLSWWLIYMPFMFGSNWIEKTLMCIMCIAFNAIYAIRALTEEKHLLHDENYKKYSTLIKDYGLYARIKKSLM